MYHIGDEVLTVRNVLAYPAGTKAKIIWVAVLEGWPMVGLEISKDIWVNNVLEEDICPAKCCVCDLPNDWYVAPNCPNGWKCYGCKLTEQMWS